MMKFEKMDNGTLRCTLTQDDLDQNGIDLDDFFSNTKDARDFLEKLIRIAEEEVGFRVNGNMMSIQAAIMSEDEIVLTFSDSNVNGSELIEHLKSMFGVPVEVEKEAVTTLPEEHVNVLEELGTETDEADESIESEAGGYVYILTFVSFSSVRNFCRILPENKDTQSRLYYLHKDNQYFLWADLNNSTKKYVYEFVAASMEYAKHIEKDSVRSRYLEEHGKMILRERALETLAQL